jgi:hypothetical protein
MLTGALPFRGASEAETVAAILAKEPIPRLTRALPFWELLNEPKELVLADDQGHVPFLEVRVPAINDFLDRQFGPVR